MNTQSQTFHSPKYLIALMESEDGWIALGARKIGRLEINMSQGRDDITGGWDYWNLGRDKSYTPVDHQYVITSDAKQFTYVKGKTQLAALGALLDTLREEEEREDAVKREYIAKQERITRFGGEIDEELIKKIVKWRKKQAKEAALVNRVLNREDIDFSSSYYDDLFEED